MGRGERVASVFLVAFGAAVAYHSWHTLKLGIAITPGAGFFPFWIGVVLAVLGVTWLAMTVVADRAAASVPAPAGADETAEREERSRNVLRRLVPGVALILAYAWLFERAGYFLSTVLFMVAWQKIVEREGWLKSAVIALACAAAMYTIFSFLLKGVLPMGTWFS